MGLSPLSPLSPLYPLFLLSLSSLSSLKVQLELLKATPWPPTALVGYHHLLLVPPLPGRVQDDGPLLAGQENVDRHVVEGRNPGAFLEDADGSLVVREVDQRLPPVHLGLR